MAHAVVLVAALLLLIGSVCRAQTPLTDNGDDVICAVSSSDCDTCLTASDKLTTPSGRCVWCDNPTNGINCQAISDIVSQPHSCPLLEYKMVTCAVNVLVISIVGVIAGLLFVACCCCCCALLGVALARPRRQTVAYQRLDVV